MRSPFARLLVAVLLFAALPLTAEAQDLPQHIRVRLFERSSVQRAVLRTEGGITLYAGAHGAALARLEAGDEIILSVRGADVRVALPDGALYTQVLRVVPQVGAQWRLTVTDAGNRRTRTYTGRLRVDAAPSASDLQLVNRAPLADYVAGVVAAEYGLGDLAGAKAMAVAARTYALRHAARSDGATQADHTGAQVYHGVGAITPTARRATRATRGEVLTYDGRLIEAVYFSASGGHTADNEDVWNAKRALPYLRGRSDPYAGGSPHARWRATIDRSRLLSRLSQRYGFDVQGFLIGERSEDGRVATIELLGPGGEVRMALQSNAFRLFVNRQAEGRGLRSTLFDARRAGDRYVFEGSGYGHGVGMSQYGAHAMAQAGYGYREILQFYYADVQLAHLDALDAPLPAPAGPVAERIPPPPPDTTLTTSDRRIGW